MAVFIADRFHVLLRVVIRPGEQDRTGSEEGFDVVLGLSERLPDNIRDRCFPTESKGKELLGPRTWSRHLLENILPRYFIKIGERSFQTSEHQTTFNNPRVGSIKEPRKSG